MQSIQFCIPTELSVIYSTLLNRTLRTVYKYKSITVYTLYEYTNRDKFCLYLFSPETWCPMKLEGSSDNANININVL